jgi:hypothetical protein
MQAHDGRKCALLGTIPGKDISQTWPSLHFNFNHDSTSSPPDPTSAPRAIVIELFPQDTPENPLDWEMRADKSNETIAPEKPTENEDLVNPAEDILRHQIQPTRRPPLNT